MPKIMPTWKHPKSGIYYFRARVPEELQKAAEKTEYRRSLGTPDKRVAAARYGDQEATYEAWLSGLNAAPLTLTRQQVESLVGVWYRKVSERISPDPDSDLAISAVLALILDSPTDALLIRRPGREWPSTITAQARTLADSEALRLSEASMQALEGRMWARVEALLALRKRRADFDYGPDPVVQQFPEWVTPSAPKVVARSAGFMAMFDLWDKGKDRQERSVRNCRANIVRFKEFVSHDYPERVTIDDVRRWRDSLYETRTKKTVNGKYLADLGAVYKTAVAHGWFPTNPVAPAVFKKSRGQKSFADSVTQRGYTDEEARTLLLAARSSSNIEHRWLTWLLAFTGERVRVPVQSVASDVKARDGLFFLDVNRNHPWKRLKEDASVRELPLHPALIREGFLEYVASLRSEDFLFPSMRPPSRDGEPGSRAMNKYSAWVKSYVSAEGLDVAHGWRHRFKTALDNSCPDDSLRRHLIGHASLGVRYGEGPKLPLKAQAIAAAPLCPNFD